MKTKALFVNIKSKIQENIGGSKESIKIVVAWFTSHDLIGQLIEKLDKGCTVHIIISDHVENSRLKQSFETFRKKGGNVCILPTKSGKFLHDKFAIFDNSQLIAGSYNWTNSAEFYNHEFVIASSDEVLIKQFNIRFNQLMKTVTDYDKTILTSNNELVADTNETAFIEIEKKLEKEFVETTRKATELRASIDTHIVFSLINQYGAVGAATRLINEGTNKLHSGFLKLREINRLDLSFESIILKDEYKFLFKKETLEKAKERLDALK